MAEPSPRRVEELFDQAIDLDPARRAAFLDEQCGGDADLRAAVEELLQLDSQTTSAELLLRSPLSGLRLPAVAPAHPAVGRYRILHLVGQGGMASVYEAEQDRTNRRVALKVIRPGLLSPALLKRFEKEVEILGRLGPAVQPQKLLHGRAQARVAGALLVQERRPPHRLQIDRPAEEFFDPLRRGFGHPTSSHGGRAQPSRLSSQTRM